MLTGVIRIKWVSKLSLLPFELQWMNQNYFLNTTESVAKRVINGTANAKRTRQTMAFKYIRIDPPPYGSLNIPLSIVELSWWAERSSYWKTKFPYIHRRAVANNYALLDLAVITLRSWTRRNDGGRVQLDAAGFALLRPRYSYWDMPMKQGDEVTLWATGYYSFVDVTLWQLSEQPVLRDCASTVKGLLKHMMVQNHINIVCKNKSKCCL